MTIRKQHPTFWIEKSTFDFHAKRLGPPAWLVYCYIDRWCDEISMPTFDEIAVNTGLNVADVSQSINTLITHGLLSFEEQPDGSRVWSVEA